jgi:hypothetical protein
VEIFQWDLLVGDAAEYGMLLQQLQATFAPGGVNLLVFAELHCV